MSYANVSDHTNESSNEAIIGSKRSCGKISWFKMNGKEEECFGLPRPWFLPFVGVAILLIGIFGLLEEFIPNMPSVWPLILIMFGVLIILAAYYRPRR